MPGSWSPYGSELLFTEYNPESGAGVWICNPTSGEAPRSLIRGRANTFAPTCSSDGRSFAYASFTDVRFGDGRWAVYGIALGDFNGDGFPDIAAAMSDAPNVVFFSVK